MVSIILNTYSPTPVQRHMDMACLAAIRKFTDQPYEIIVVDNVPKYKIRDEYGVLNLENETIIENKKNHTVYESYNQGAEVAKYDNLMFIQSDVYVHERTINKLAKYLGQYDMAFPQQIPISREMIKELYVNADPEFGQRDAGLLAITKEAFQRVGGWDGRFKNLLGEAAFYSKCADAGVSWTDRTDAIITHIMAGHNLRKDQDLYDEQMKHDSDLFEKEYK